MGDLRRFPILMPLMCLLWGGILGAENQAKTISRSARNYGYLVDEFAKGDQVFETSEAAIGVFLDRNAPESRRISAAKDTCRSATPIPEERLDALVSIASSPDEPEEVRVWATVVLGKGLTVGQTSLAAEAKLFGLARDTSVDIDVQWTSLWMLLGASESQAVVKRELHRMLVSPQMADANLVGRVKMLRILCRTFETVSREELANMFLAAYVEDAPIVRRQALLEVLGGLDFQFHQDELTPQTRKDIREISVREFCREQNPTKLRFAAFTLMDVDDDVSSDTRACLEKWATAPETPAPFRECVQRRLNAIDKRMMLPAKTE